MSSRAILVRNYFRLAYAVETVTQKDHDGHIISHFTETQVGLDEADCMAGVNEDRSFLQTGFYMDVDGPHPFYVLLDQDKIVQMIFAALASNGNFITDRPDIFVFSSPRRTWSGGE